MEPAHGNLAVPRGLLSVGGAPVVRHQLTLALALECQRIICLARDFSPGMVSLQHEAERGGAQFHVITGGRQLAGLVTANDDVLVLADGLLTAPQRAAELLGGGAVVLVQPVESGTAAGFERMDLNHAAAGAMRIPGRLVERLSELPSDCDVASALTRIALQAGVRQQMVPAEVREGAAWRLIRDENEAHAAESGWISLHIGEVSARTPGPVLARQAVHRFGPALLHAGSGSGGVTIAAGILFLLGMLAGWFDYTAIGFIWLGLAWLVRLGADLLARIERDSFQQAPSFLPRAALFGWLIDVAVIVLVVWDAPFVHWQTWADRLFAPAILLGLLRVLPRCLPKGWGDWLGDRVLLCAALAIAAVSDALMAGIEGLALLLLFGALMGPAIGSRLTRP